MTNHVSHVRFHTRMASWWLRLARWYEARQQFDQAEDCHAEVAWHQAKIAFWSQRVAA